MAFDRVLTLSQQSPDLGQCRVVQGFPVIFHVRTRGSFGKPCTTLHTPSDLRKRAATLHTRPDLRKHMKVTNNGRG